MEASRWRPSPGTVLGLLALVVAVAGTAIAGPLATTSALNKKEKRVVRKVAKKQANRQITRRAPGLNVNSAKSTDEVHNSGRVVLNDPAPGLPYVSSEPFAAGPFTIWVSCVENASAAAEAAQVNVLGPSGSSVSGPTTDPSGSIEIKNATSVPFAFAFGSGNDIGAGHVTAVAPNGQVVSVSASVEVNDTAGGECVFGVTAIGP